MRVLMAVFSVELLGSGELDLTPSCAERARAGGAHRATHLKTGSMAQRAVALSLEAGQHRMAVDAYPSLPHRKFAIG